MDVDDPQFDDEHTATLPEDVLRALRSVEVDELARERAITAALAAMSTADSIATSESSPPARGRTMPAPTTTSSTAAATPRRGVGLIRRR